MRLPKVRLTLRIVRILAALLVCLAGSSILLFMNSAPNHSAPPQRPGKSYFIMEGVDINSNGAGRLPPALPRSERRVLLPPDLQSGQRP
jgi:hypothetical protein